jgi:hypothetical protein
MRCKPIIFLATILNSNAPALAETFSAEGTVTLIQRLYVLARHAKRVPLIQYE